MDLTSESVICAIQSLGIHSFMPARSRIISTLCPKRLGPSECIDISNRMAPSLVIPSCGKTYLWYGLGDSRFPPNTRGFLYYHTPPKAPPLVGEIRFRLANNLAKFNDGEDLLNPNKAPWSIPLYALANRPSRSILRDKLLRDGLISQTTLDQWAKEKLSLLYTPYQLALPNRPVLYYLCQPFYQRFNTCHTGFYVATKEEIGMCTMYSYMRDHHFREGACAFPYGGELYRCLLFENVKLIFFIFFYAGSGLVRLEPYNDRLAMRVLKILEPVQDLIEGYDGRIHRPKEGELVQRSGFKHPDAGVVKKLIGESVKELNLPVHLEDLA